MLIDKAFPFGSDPPAGAFEEIPFVGSVRELETAEHQDHQQEQRSQIETVHVQIGVPLFWPADLNDLNDIDQQKKEVLMYLAKEIKYDAVHVDFLSERDVEILTKIGIPDSLSPYIDIECRYSLIWQDCFDD